MAKDTLEVMLAKAVGVKQVQESELLAYSNVVGVGIGFKTVNGKESKDVAVVVYVEKKIDRDKLPADVLIPATLPVPETSKKIKTDVVETGRIEAQAFKTRIRPVRPGYSIGHYKITAGTFGCLVRETCSPCRTYILSNNHVLANSNAAHIGDPILQPGPYDGGKYPADMVARLSRFIPIHFGSPARYNLVDAALARPLQQRYIIASVAGLGMPRGTVEATLGMEVVKSGRTTQITTGKVTGIDVTVSVNYGVGVGYFRNQILTTNMSKGGDSGSLLMSRADHQATGLLFAGSDRVTIHNNIANVLMAFGVEIITA
jgi:hypothetical protein